MATYDFTGRRAVITGGARGMGRAIAERFLRAGAAVTLWDVAGDRLAETRAALAPLGKVMAQDVDVADYSAVAAAADTASEELGGIELLVNAAGIAGATAPVTEFPLNSWNAVLAVNLTGTFHTCRAIVPHMQRSGYGRIANIASIAGKEGNPNASAYSVSKAGVIGLTKSLGKELAGTEIRVNVLCPAVVRTEMLNDMTEEHIAYMLSKIPMGRAGSLDEITELVSFMCSDGCSYSTGAVFDMSGGRATY